MAKELKIGDKAPEFSLPDSNGKKTALKDFRGKKVALYFYPKDDTPGCTAEACSVRDNFEKLKKAGIVVIGVSIDSEESHKKFSEKHNLPHILLADKNKEVVEKYRVWGHKARVNEAPALQLEMTTPTKHPRFVREKNMYGKKYMGTLRKTFLIDEEGKVVHIFEKVNTGEHAREIMEGFEEIELEEESDQEY